MRNKLFLLIFLGQALVATTAHAETPTLALHEDKAVKLPKSATLPDLKSSIALIYDEKTQLPLYMKNADVVAPIASITKLMTAMIVLDAALPMNEMIRISREDMDTLKGTHSRMRPGMALTRGELFKLSLMASENRAAAALARTFPGGTRAAIARMNAKARELGMHDTRFLDPTGLNSGNVSTAQDLVRLVQAAQTYPKIREASTKPSHKVAPAGYGALQYNNTNPLVKNDSWDIGVSKTGYISEAGRCLVMRATINLRPVVIVLLDSWGKNTRIGDANRIKKWMETNAAPRPAVHRG